MQKYCTPSHPQTARFEALGRYSVVDRATSSLSRMLEGIADTTDGRNHINIMNQTHQQGFGAAAVDRSNAGDMRLQYNKTDLSTKQSTTRHDGRKKHDMLLPLNTNIQVGSISVRNKSIAEVDNQLQEEEEKLVVDAKYATMDDKMYEEEEEATFEDIDGIIIAPAASKSPNTTR